MCSVSWRPTESIGWSEVIGSWKTIPMSRPETARRARASSRSKSLPPNSARPSTTAPAGSRPSSASIDIVLPLPLSPATPKTWAGSTW